MEKMEGIVYSERLIEEVKILAKALADSTDPNSQNQKIRAYLDPTAHIQRIRNNVLAIKQIQRVAIGEDKHILEIGSGIGTCCLIMKLFTHAFVTGIEPAPESYHNLIQCIKEFQVSNTHLPYKSLNCSGEAIVEKDDYFDFVYSFEVMEHVQDPYRVFQEVYRVLKPGGIAYIATCNYDSFYEGHYKCFWNPFIGVEGNRKRLLRKRYSPQFLSELNYITKKKIIEWCNNIGFQEICFNPMIDCQTEKKEVHLSYPNGFILPTKTTNSKSTWLHRNIEKPIPTKILSLMDREYKLYFLLKKGI